MGSVNTQQDPTYDIIIIGAGLSGICSLYHIRQRCPSWRVLVLEAAEGAGGTWFWNRYPGARFDSESITYGFSWDKELLEEWHWKETFAPQPETLRYIQRVCDKHNLYEDIQFNTHIKSAKWDDENRSWTFTDDKDQHYTTRFFVSCLGVLSQATLPKIPGIQSFRGKSFHTSRWPKDLDLKRDFEGKRIGVIGTGATGIQTITTVAKEPGIKSIHVFQRTANWSAPLRNQEISLDEMSEIRKRYDDIFKQCSETPSCFMHAPDPRKSSDVTQEERLALWENVYSQPGFSKWLGVFSDTYTDKVANKLYSDFMAAKIRSRVHNANTADSLIPKDHGFGTRRVPLESGYFETYNQANVHLVDLKKTPMTEITATGIRTADGIEHELDVLIYATGFDAITGAFNAITWEGKDGRPLIASSKTSKKAPIWPDHLPRTFMGLTTPCMPNMFMVLGPHQPFGNIPRSIEHAVWVITDLLEMCNDHGYTYVEAKEESAQQWTDHVFELGSSGLINEVASWLTGVNTNVEGKTIQTVARYAGSAIDYRKRCEEYRAKGWPGLILA